MARASLAAGSVSPCASPWLDYAVRCHKLLPHETKLSLSLSLRTLTRRRRTATAERGAAREPVGFARDARVLGVWQGSGAQQRGGIQARHAWCRGLPGRGGLVRHGHVPCRQLIHLVRLPQEEYDSGVQQTIGFTSTRVQRRKSGESSGCGDRERSLNDGQIPNTRAVRVHVSTGYNRAEGNRRASRNGRVSDLPRNRVTIRNFVIAKRCLKADVVCAPSPPPGGNGT
jgi:hypothetical protein